MNISLLMQGFVFIMSVHTINILILKLLVCILSNALSQRVRMCTSTGTKYVRIRMRLPSRPNS